MFSHFVPFFLYGVESCYEELGPGYAGIEQQTGPWLRAKK
jgi:hypothetical protein